jgi:hypothetical protein
MIAKVCELDLYPLQVMLVEDFPCQLGCRDREISLLEIMLPEYVVDPDPGGDDQGRGRNQEKNRVHGWLLSGHNRMKPTAHSVKDEVLS